MRTVFAGQHFFDVNDSHYHFITDTHTTKRFTKLIFVRVAIIPTYNTSLMYT